jgi:hypothetical protein
MLFMGGVLLLGLRFGTIFKDASTKTRQNRGYHQEEKQACEIGFVLDRSGSMNAMKDEAIGGITLFWNLSRNSE